MEYCIPDLWAINRYFIGHEGAGFSWEMLSQINSTSSWCRTSQSFGGIDMHCGYLKCSTRHIANVCDPGIFFRGSPHRKIYW